MSKSVIIIGAGVGGLATACMLGQAGYNVTIYEKNKQAGGQVGTFEAQGFRFDTGPSWYLMPEVFEKFFAALGEDVQRLLDLKQLDPSYRVYFKDTLYGGIDIYSDIAKDSRVLESIEPGTRQKLADYLDYAAYQYEFAMNQFLYKNYNSILDLVSPRVIRQTLQHNIFGSMQKQIQKYFTTPELQKIIQYPLLFLGASSSNVPALYSFLNHSDFRQGILYPNGGMYEITKTLVSLAKARGVSVFYNSPVKRIRVHNGLARGVILEDGTRITADIVISNADVAHTELSLLPTQSRTHSRHYFKKKITGPSALIIYLGVSKRYRNLQHHNLIFSQNWDANFKALLDKKSWPSDPSFYVCNLSKTDRSTAPKGKDTLKVVVPLPATTKYTETELATYADWVLKTMEETMHLKDLRKHIEYKKLFGAKDFQQTFNSYQGTALGFAQTFKQTAAFRPSNMSKKVKYLYYVGADTIPGVGIPMCLISAQLVYKRIVGIADSKPVENIPLVQS